VISPIEAFKRAMFRISFLSSRLFEKKPGAVIARMSEEEREALKGLKSSEIDGSKERITDLTYYSDFDGHYEKKKFEKEMLEFDKKILGK
jgi:hypothetical protein